MVERRPIPSGRPLPSGRAVRSLFGPVDHEETDRVLRREVARHMEEYKRKYNFDFDTDTPLPGIYNWQIDAPSTRSPIRSGVSAVSSAIRVGATTPSSRLAAPMALRLTINHPVALGSEGEEEEQPETPITPETPGSCSDRGSSDESDYDSESPLERCIRRHNYDLRSIHPASTPNSLVAVPSTSALITPSTPSTTSSASSQHARPVALYSPAKCVVDQEGVVECAPVSLDPIVEGCRSPIDPNASSHPRQTKITGK